MCGKEGVGFEPTGDLTATTRLANERNRPDSAIPPKKRIKFRYSYYMVFLKRCQPLNLIFLFFLLNKKILLLFYIIFYNLLVKKIIFCDIIYIV